VRRKPPIATDKRLGSWTGMGIVLTFLLGIGNFSMHKAVIESRHPLLGQVPWFMHLLGGKAGLVTEFLLLLGAMLLVADGYAVWGWAYFGYTVFNSVAAWLILTRRI
jgi:hypothetical protein